MYIRQVFGQRGGGFRPHSVVFMLKIQMQTGVAEGYCMTKARAETVYLIGYG
jgi:hypothetical protein